MKLFQLELKNISSNFTEYFYILTTKNMPELNCFKIEWAKYKFVDLKLYAEDENIFIDNQKILKSEDKNEKTRANN